VNAALAYPARQEVRWYSAGGATLAFILLLGIPEWGRSWRNRIGLLIFLVTLTGSLLGCGGGGGGVGGGGNPGTTRGIYTVTVTGTSGSTTTTSTVTLTVQ